MSLSPFLHSPVADALSDDSLQRTWLGSAKSKQLARLHWSRFPLLTEVIFLHAVIPSEARNLSSDRCRLRLRLPVAPSTRQQRLGRRPGWGKQNSLQRVNHGNERVDLHGLSVQVARSVVPLPDRLQRRIDKQWISTHDL
jgi:hypothetical protein